MSEEKNNQSDGLSKEAEELLEKSKKKDPKTGLKEPKQGQTPEEAVEEEIKKRNGNTEDE